ncbi:MAG TPA: glycosyltransferase family 4 protein [Solirubrobacterales bacterium]|nr:glycosyltransferase family 4 protein [Solirubrobacterales bacterium]
MSRDSSKVVVIFHEPVLGGATISVLRTIPLLEERGWRFSFWVDRPSPLFDELEGRGYDVDGDRRLVAWSLPVLRQPPGFRRRLTGTPPYLARLRRFLRNRDPALVHANSIIALPEALVAKRQAPVLFHVHEMSRDSIRGRIARRLAWRADELVAVSRASGERLARGAPVPRIVYEAAPLPEKAAPVRESPDPFVIGTIGVISRRKGSDVFVAAAERVLAATAGVEFRLVGGLTDILEAEWGRELIARATEAGIVCRERVDTLEELRSWDAFVLPSRTDPFPIAMLEAMGSGLPVIGAASDGIAEQVTPECGDLVPSDDPEALAAAMVRMARRSGEERAAMGRAGRRRVAENFTVERQAAGLDDAYRAAIRAGNGSRG